MSMQFRDYFPFVPYPNQSTVERAKVAEVAIRTVEVAAKHFIDVERQIYVERETARVAERAERAAIRAELTAHYAKYARADLAKVAEDTATVIIELTAHQRYAAKLARCALTARRATRIAIEYANLIRLAGNVASVASDIAETNLAGVAEHASRWQHAIVVSRIKLAATIAVEVDADRARTKLAEHAAELAEFAENAAEIGARLLSTPNRNTPNALDAKCAAKQAARCASLAAELTRAMCQGEFGE